MRLQATKPNICLLPPVMPGGVPFTTPYRKRKNPTGQPAGGIPFFTDNARARSARARFRDPPLARRAQRARLRSLVRWCAPRAPRVLAWGARLSAVLMGAKAPFPPALSPSGGKGAQAQKPFFGPAGCMGARRSAVVRRRPGRAAELIQKTKFCIIRGVDTPEPRAFARPRRLAVVRGSRRRRAHCADLYKTGIFCIIRGRPFPGPPGFCWRLARRFGWGFALSARPRRPRGTGRGVKKGFARLRARGTPRDARP